jgi:hypothetical protein
MLGLVFAAIAARGAAPTGLLTNFQISPAYGVTVGNPLSFLIPRKESPKLR